MEKRCGIALIGDYNAAVTAHQAIPKALKLAGDELGVTVEEHWLHTSLLRDPARQLADFEGVWCVPASPYENEAGALEAIRYVRERQVPYLGTCAGFQYAMVEFARDVLGIESASHAESNPDGDTLVISKLSCSLVEKSEDLLLSEGGIVRKAYGDERITEGYRCNYGINAGFEKQLFSGALKVAARGPENEVRAFELEGHPFFVGTLFQPERRALRGEAPPLVVAFVDAMN